MTVAMKIMITITKIIKVQELQYISNIKNQEEETGRNGGNRKMGRRESGKGSTLKIRRKDR